MDNKLCCSVICTMKVIIDLNSVLSMYDFCTRLISRCIARFSHFFRFDVTYQPGKRQSANLHYVYGSVLGCFLSLAWSFKNFETSCHLGGVFGIHQTYLLGNWQTQILPLIAILLSYHFWQIHIAAIFGNFTKFRSLEAAPCSHF